MLLYNFINSNDVDKTHKTQIWAAANDIEITKVQTWPPKWSFFVHTEKQRFCRIFLKMEMSSL